MKTISLRNLTIGAGKPKIIAPLTGNSLSHLLTQAEQLTRSPAEIAEWRVDYLPHPINTENLLDIACELRKALGEIPLLATYRTFQEGGQGGLNTAEYTALVETLALSGLVDLVDVELSAGDATVSRLLSRCHAQGVPALLSCHDFFSTPSAPQLRSILAHMEDLGADIAKIAVMPRCPADVVTLLQVTEAFSRHSACPMVTMSMGELGKVSRVWGEVFGCALTFAAVTDVSAPGQLPADTVAALLDVLSPSEAGF